MKKTRLILAGLLAALLLTLVLPALADNHPVSPHQRKVWDMERYSLLPEGSISKGAPCTLTISQNSAPALGKTGSWHVDVKERKQVKGAVYLTAKDYTDSYSTIYYKEVVYPCDYESCELLAPGDYSVWLALDNYPYVVERFDFSLKPDGVHPTIDDKVSEIVRICETSDPWITALNLHDWLTENCYYDLNYEFYGADMLLRGKGVCDSYSKDYLLLCEKAGIRASRVIGSAGGGSHAWNAIQLNGNWYYVDVTWDDPAGKEEPLSGSERRHYFCVNEELLSINHKNDKTVFQEPCVRMDMNWHVKNYLPGELGNFFVNNDYPAPSGARFDELIPRLIAGGTLSGSISCGDALYLNNSYGLHYPTRSSTTDYCRVLLSYVLSSRPLGESLVTFRFDPATNRMSYAAEPGRWVLETTWDSGTESVVRGYVCQDDRSRIIITETILSTVGKPKFRLPSGITEIQSSALSHSRTFYVIIPPFCEEIGSEAFANMPDLRVVLFEGADTRIAPDVFAGERTEDLYLIAEVNTGTSEQFDSLVSDYIFLAR